jgi:hypothetical protein
MSRYHIGDVELQDKHHTYSGGKPISRDERWMLNGAAEPFPNISGPEHI